MSNKPLPVPAEASLADPVLPAPRWRFDRTDKLMIDGVAHFCLDSQKTHHVVALVSDPDICIKLTDDQVRNMAGRGQLKIERAGLARNVVLRSSEPKQNLHDLPSSELREVLHVQTLCDDFLRREAQGRASRSDASMRAVIAESHAEWQKLDIKIMTADGRSGSRNTGPIIIPPSPSTLRRKLRRYEAANFDVRALIKNYGRSGNRSRRFSKKVRKLVDKYARKYMSRLKPTKISLYKKLDRKIRAINRQRAERGSKTLTVPSRQAFFRAIDKLPQYQILAARHGEDYAKKKLLIINQGVDATRPLERVEMDEWRVPLQTLLENAGLWSQLPKQERAKAKRTRVWLSTAIDTATRVVLAARLIFSPSAATAVATVEMAMGDKSAVARDAGCQKSWHMGGTYETTVTDGGSSWLSQEFRSANVDLGATAIIAPAKAPYLRPYKERLYKTLHTGLVQHFSGRTHENILVKGDYDSEANACIDYEELGKNIVRYIVDVYHLTPHDGLAGATPFDTWNDLTQIFRILPPPDADVARHVFGVSWDRKVSGKGVRILGLYYQSPELQRHRLRARSSTVTVRVDPNDLGYVSVRVDDGWITVKCAREGMDRVSVVHWLLSAQRIREHNAARAKVHQHIVDKALDDIERFAEHARKRAGIASPVMSHKDFERFERDLFRSFDFTSDDEGSAAEQSTPANTILDGKEKSSKPAPDVPSQDAPTVPLTTPPAANTSDDEYDDDDEYGDTGEYGVEH